MRAVRLRLAILASLTAAAVAVVGAQTSSQGDDGFRFKSGVELVNVTATVSDENGHFVSGPDARTTSPIYEDGQPQEVSHFSNERVPVSLGILLDTSGSMTPEKMSAARIGDRSLHLRPARQRRRTIFHAVSQASPSCCRAGPPIAARSAARWAGRRRRAARRCTTRLRGAADCRRRPQSEEGDARHLRRQRHEQSRRRSASCDSMIRESEVHGLRAWRRRRTTCRPTRTQPRHPSSPPISVPVPRRPRPVPAGIPPIAPQVGVPPHRRGVWPHGSTNT